MNRFRAGASVANSIWDFVACCAAGILRSPFGFDISFGDLCIYRSEDPEVAFRVRRSILGFLFLPQPGPRGRLQGSTLDFDNSIRFLFYSLALTQPSFPPTSVSLLLFIFLILDSPSTPILVLLLVPPSLPPSLPSSLPPTFLHLPLSSSLLLLPLLLPLFSSSSS